MKNILMVFTAFIFVTSCKRGPSTKISSNLLLVDTALQYKGIPYKYGGITTAGMDCSGLVFKAFGDLGVPFKRSSYEQAEVFKQVNKNDIRIGDLVYFKIGKTGRINHTGIVTKIVNKDVVLFLHSSSSAGVREDNLFSKYWKPKFVKVTRPGI